MQQLDPSLTKQHYKTVIFKAYLHLLRRKCSEEEIKSICTNMGLPLEYIQNEDNWVSVIFERRFMTEIKKILTIPNICFESGRIGLSKELLGNSIYFFLKYVLSTDILFKKMAQVTELFNRVTKIDIISAKSGSLHVEIRPIFEGLNSIEKKALLSALEDIMENTKGYYCAAPLLKSTRPAKVEINLHCDKRNEPYYSIKVEYPTSSRFKSFFKGLIPLFSGALVASNIFFQLSNPLTTGLLVTLSLGIVFLLLKYLDTRKVVASTESLLKKTDHQYKELHQAQESLQRKLKESILVNKIIQGLTRVTSVQEVLNKACQDIVQILGYDRAFIMLQDSGGKYLEYKSSYGETDQFAQILKSFKLSIDITSNDPRETFKHI